MKKKSNIQWYTHGEDVDNIRQSWSIAAWRDDPHEETDSSYCFTSVTRQVEWWNEDEIITPIEEIYLESHSDRKNFVEVEDVWKGRIIEDSQDFFVARLSDIKYRHDDRIVKILKHKIDDSLRDEIYEGAIFEWTFGKRYTTKAENYQKMSFKPRLKLDSNDIDMMVKELTRGFEDIFKEPEEDET